MARLNGYGNQNPKRRQRLSDRIGSSYMHTLSLSLSLGLLLATCTPTMVATASSSSSTSLSSSSATSATYSSSSSSASSLPVMSRIGDKMNGIRGKKSSSSRQKQQKQGSTSATLKTESSPHFLQDWTRARCGPTGNAMWAYQGALYDPLDGKQIAQVQGLELVRCLSEADTDSVANKQRYRRRCGDLSMATLLSDRNTTFDYASTVLSRRLFLYTPVSSDVDASKSPSSSSARQILREIRLRPGSPIKKIPSNQAAAVYDTASTVVSRNSGGGSGGGDPASTVASEWLVHSEFKDGRSLWSMAQSKEPIVSGNLVQTGGGGGRGNQGNKKQKRPWSLEFMVYARPRFTTKQLPDLTTPPAPERGAQNATTTISPGRSALIQFGQSAAESQGRFGVRETYHYTMGGEDHKDNGDSNSNRSPAALAKWLKKQTTRGGANDGDIADSWPSCSVRYTRYGEGPPWYGPHRMCTLELTGKRIRDSSEAPALAARFAEEQVPGFLSVDAPIPTQDSQAARAVDWFRGKGGSASVLQITPGDDDERNNRPVWMNKIQDSATSVVDRVREATAISIGGNAGK